MATTQSDSINKIGLFTATIVSMNCMMGVGIFATPVELAAKAGPASILSMIFVIVAVWFMGVSIARVASVVAAEGSFYAYVKSWGGHFLGMVAAGAYIFGLVFALGGALGHIAGIYAHQLLQISTPATLGLIILCTLIILNLLGVVISKLVQYILISLTVFALLSTTVFCLLHADTSNLTPFVPHGTWSIFAAMPVFIFGLFGFESAASLYPIVENASKNIPKALAYAITIVGCLYILFVGSILLAIPNELFTHASLPITTPLSQVLTFGRWIVPMISFAIITAVSGVIHSMIWSSSSLLHSLFKNAKTPMIKNAVNSNTLSTRMAVFLIGSAMILFHIARIPLGVIFPYVAASILLSYMLTMFALLKTKYRTSPVTWIGFATATVIFGASLQMIWALFA